MAKVLGKYVCSSFRHLDVLYYLLTAMQSAIIGNTFSLALMSYHSALPITQMQGSMKPMFRWISQISMIYIVDSNSMKNLYLMYIVIIVSNSKASC